MAVHHQYGYLPQEPQVPTNGQRIKTRIAAARPAIRVETLVVLIPLFYNPDACGRRLPVESWKLLQTEAEVRRLFTGYAKSTTTGWYRDVEQHKEYLDRLTRYEIDGTFDPRRLRALRLWKRQLARRFRQVAIYMRLTNSGAWL